MSPPLIGFTSRRGGNGIGLRGIRWLDFDCGWSSHGGWSTALCVAVDDSGEEQFPSSAKRTFSGPTKSLLSYSLVNSVSSNACGLRKIDSLALSFDTRRARTLLAFSSSVMSSMVTSLFIRIFFFFSGLAIISAWTLELTAAIVSKAWWRVCSIGSTGVR